MLEPEGVGAAIMSTVAQITTRRPEEPPKSDEQRCREEDEETAFRRKEAPLHRAHLAWEIWCKNIKSREGGLTALEGDLRKALGRSFLRWEKDNVKGTTASVTSILLNVVEKALSRPDRPRSRLLVILCTNTQALSSMCLQIFCRLSTELSDSRNHLRGMAGGEDANRLRIHFRFFR